MSLISRLYGAGNCWHRLSGVPSKLVNQLSRANKLSRVSRRYRFSKYVILKHKGSDTFEVVQVNTGQGVIRNVNFLRKAPPHIDRPRQYEDEHWLEQQENIPQEVNPPQEGNPTPRSGEEPVTPSEEHANQENVV